MDKHLDWCTHIQFGEDIDILTRCNFDVNIRLLKTNNKYKDLIQQCCSYIEHCAKIEKEGYKVPHGWSGANAGIPFRIICVKYGSHYITMINPVISQSSGVKQVFSNCGSLTLSEPIKSFRNKIISVDYFDIDGNKKTWENIEATPGYTIQHEINHTYGMLING